MKRFVVLALLIFTLPSAWAATSYERNTDLMETREPAMVSDLLNDINDVGQPQCSGHTGCEDYGTYDQCLAEPGPAKGCFWTNRDL